METNQALPECPDCHVDVGQLHKLGCDVEPCPYCGNPLLSCDHSALFNNDSVPRDDRMPWTGLWPGFKECHEFGWYVKADGTSRCTKDDEGAVEDLCRLLVEARWDRPTKQWVKTEATAEAED